MTRKLCITLVVIAWLTGFLNTALHTVFTIHLPFCGENGVNYFYCDIPALLALSCGDLLFNVTMILASSLVVW